MVELPEPHKKKVCIPGAASTMIKSLEPSGTNASAIIRAVSGFRRKARNRCPSIIAKYWRHLSIGGKFSFDLLKSSSVSGGHRGLRVRFFLAGALGTSVDDCEELIGLSEKK